jgi:signal transduction histidine kinase
LDEELAYVAVPISSDGKITGAVRISFPTEEVREEVRENWLRLGLLSALVLATAASLGWIVARWAVQPVTALEKGAASLAAGDLSGRAEVDRGPPELQHLAETFNNMAAHLEILVGSQQAFVADASHQLRTPLTAMRLRIESLEDALETPGANVDWVLLRADAEAISSEVERLTHLVDGLLALARSESSLSLESVDVAAVTTQAVERWQPLAEESGVEILLSCPATAQARVVRGGLEQILDNLLDNAIGVAPPNTAIALSVSSESECVTLSVEDHGPGMSAVEKERSTRRFWRAPGAEPGGSGLGLSIVAELAAASGGSVQLSDPPDHSGLKVTVTLLVSTSGVATS